MTAVCISLARGFRSPVHSFFSQAFLSKDKKVGKGYTQIENVDIVQGALLVGSSEHYDSIVDRIVVDRARVPVFWFIFGRECLPSVVSYY
jgi:hypothetical protein